MTDDFCLSDKIKGLVAPNGEIYLDYINIVDIREFIDWVLFVLDNYNADIRDYENRQDLLNRIKRFAGQKLIGEGDGK